MVQIALQATMATTSTVAPAAIGFSFFSVRRRTHGLVYPTTATARELAAGFRFLSMTTSYSASLTGRICASGSEREEDSPSNPKPNSVSAFLEDTDYLWKLAIGSVVGAGVIKYGSIVSPDITRPDILQALFIISTPVIVSVLLLSLASSRK